MKRSERVIISIEAAASEINKTTNLDQVLLQICQVAVQLFDVDHSGLVLFDKDGDSGKVVAEFPDLGTVNTRIPVRGIPAEERLIYQQEPILLNAVPETPPAELGSVAQTFASFAIRAILVVPVVSQGRVIGSFSLDAIERDYTFTDEDIELCRVFAAHIANALDKARLVREVQQHAEQAEMLRTMTTALTSEYDQRHLLELIVMQATQQLHAHGGGIYIYDAHQQTFALGGVYGHGDPPLAPHVHQHEGIVGMLVTEDLPFLIVSDYANWTERVSTYHDVSPFEAVIAVPIRWQMQTLGVLFVDAERGRVFTTQDASLLRVFADYAALALGNALLHHTHAVTAAYLEHVLTGLETLVQTISGPGLDEQVQSIANQLATPPPLPESPLPLPKQRDDDPQLTGRINQLFANLRTTLIRPTAPPPQATPDPGWPALVAQAPGAMMLTNHAGKLMAASPCAALLLGYPEATLAEQTLATLMVDPQAMPRLLRSLARSPDMCLIEEIGFYTARHEALPVKLRARQCRLPGEDQHGIIITFEELRPLQTAQTHHALLVQASKLLTMADGLPEALRSLGDGLVKSLNLACCRIYLADTAEQLILQASQAVPGLAWHPGLGTTMVINAWPELAHAIQQTGLTVINQPQAWGRQTGLPSSVRSVVLMPLRHRDGLVGLLELGRGVATPTPDFAEADRALIEDLATHTAPLIDRIRQQELNEYHQNRLDQMERAVRTLRADNDASQLRNEILRLAIDMLRQTMGVFYLVRPHLGEVEIAHVYGLPEALVGYVHQANIGLAGRVVQTGTPLVSASLADDPADPLAVYRWHNAYAAPIECGGELVGVVLVGGVRRDSARHAIDLTVLTRFVWQAASVLQTAQLSGREQRVVWRMALLGQLSRFCQETTQKDLMLHAFLTAITAGYGLRFNRAMVFLVNERQDYLIGHMGIGHLSLEEANEDWATLEQDGMTTFQTYLEHLSKQDLPPTPLFERINALRIPLTQDEPDLLRTILGEPGTMTLAGSELDHFLPPRLLDVLTPRGPTAIAPLMVGEKIQGMVIVDNAFTQAAITKDDSEALLIFAHTIAVALKNQNLVSQYQATQQSLHTLLEGSHKPVSGGAETPEQVLKAAVHQVCAVVEAMWVSIILINDLGEVTRAISTRDGIFEAQSIVRENGVSMDVLRSGEPQIFDQTMQYQDRLQPVIFKRGVGAAACLPLMTGERRFGVLWIHWHEAHPSLPAELEAVRLYLNQVALAYQHAAQIRLLEQIRHAAEGIGGAENWHDVLEQVARHGCILLGGTAAVVWSYDAASGQIEPARSAGYQLARDVWHQLKLQPARTDRLLNQALSGGWYAESDLRGPVAATAPDQPMALLLEQTSARALQIVALQHREALLGFLTVVYKRPQRFAAEDRNKARLFANSAAMVLSKAALFDRLRLSQGHLDAAQETMRLVTSASMLEHPEEALRSIVEGVRTLLNADTAVIYVCDAKQRQLTYAPVASGVLDPRSVAQKVRVLRESLVAQVIHHDGVLIIDDVSTDPRFGISHFVRREEIVATIATPLICGTMRVGALFVSYRKPHPFSAEEIEHLTLLANQAAIAIRSDQCYRERERQRSTFEALRQAGHAVADSLVHTTPNPASLQLTLDCIAEQSLLLISPEVRDRSFSHLAMVEGNYLRFTAAHPGSYLEQLHHQVGNIDLDGPQIGITGRAVQRKEVIRIDHVQYDTDYLSYDPAVTSELAVPIKLGNQVFGVINLEHPSEAAFDEEDEHALQLLADYAATALQHNRLYACLELVQEMGRRVAMNQPIDLFLHQLCHRLEADIFRGCLVSVRLAARHYDERPVLTFKPGWSSPKSHGDEIVQAFGEGICGYVAAHRRVVNCPDVHQLDGEPGYLDLVPDKPFRTVSELCVPITWGNEHKDMLGVLDVQSPRQAAFAHDDEQLLGIIAGQIASALHNADHIESLSSMRRIVGGRTSLEWMRTMVNVWRHEIEDYAQNIRNQVLMAEMRPPAGQSFEQWIKVRLGEIDINARRILDRSLTPALKADEGVQTTPLDDFVRRCVNKLWILERYTATIASPQLDLHAQASVQVNQELLRIAIEMLIRNAIHAMREASTRHLRLATQRTDRHVQLTVEDSGPGIPPAIQPLIFKEQVLRPEGGRVGGTGLMMVRAIIEAYGGRVDLVKTGPEGTTMMLELPIEGGT
ncbi:GAF domain-containing protein [Candidatus Chloroploca sp. M-50]|uniref:histidine kinase n=1 Tax=Candidatus Chloroploca mongolica TaxID=2528176 RepID=A0ABS4DFN0_9CHLR|nr:GAF domain-containing protein [Candidatus Chloroploca mongolica]MBP1468237.1 GAF domain-containing protein [Candidatus Chloroploca mongolica]